MEQIREVLQETQLYKVEVSVKLVSQDPPFKDTGTALSRNQNSNRLRKLQDDTEQDATSENPEKVEQVLIFNVFILLQSILTEHDINRYIVGAFDKGSEQLTYR